MLNSETIANQDSNSSIWITHPLGYLTQILCATLPIFNLIGL